MIFSPQPWNHLYISKHHYALELAKSNTVWFICGPKEQMGTGNTVTGVEGSDGLRLVKYKIPLPSVLKFKWPSAYKQVTERKLRSMVKKLIPKIDWCIDFGCYQFFDSLNFVEATRKIYFPVDDFSHLKLTSRGAEKILSVSINIVDKFRKEGLECEFINHGLAEEFERPAKVKMQEKDFSNHNHDRLQFAYSGNLFLRFMDIPVLKDIIATNPSVDFHFFGGGSFDQRNMVHADWNSFLSAASNVKVHGFLPAEKLANAYKEMDGFLLCYKPDYKDYHAENSHKVFEYLSTGKVMVSTYLSIYEGNELINMSPKDLNEELNGVFKETVARIDEYNSASLQCKRVALAIDNTYRRQLERIEQLFEKVKPVERDYADA